ncbi:hypothetical protein [Thalassotalea fusca]
MKQKLIISNLSVLNHKYVSEIGLIEKSLNALIKADNQRGIDSQVIYLDDSAKMQGFKAPVVTNSQDEKQNKDAITALVAALKPASVTILGGPEVVPFQRLENPMTTDGDDAVPSDLPYACSEPFSEKITDFLKPVVAITRLPDVIKATKATALLNALDTAINSVPQKKSHYDNYLAISAKVWQGSTAESVTHIFGNDDELQYCPPENNDWSDSQLGAPCHFINCHGADHDQQWYGQQGLNYPVALSVDKLAGKSAEFAIVAAECCYGAQLYAVNGQSGLCNCYLENKASTFCGSTNIAYGPASGQGQADYIAQFYVNALRQGHDLADAMLIARQQFIHQSSPLTPADLKTIAQFVCYGDSTVAPVIADKARAKAKAFDLTESNIAYYSVSKSMAMPDVVKDEIYAITEKLGIKSEPVVHSGQLNVVQESVTAKNLRPARQHNFHSIIYTNVERVAVGQVSNVVLHIVEEQGKVVKKDILYSKG